MWWMVARWRAYLLQSNGSQVEIGYWSSIGRHVGWYVCQSSVGRVTANKLTDIWLVQCVYGQHINQVSDAISFKFQQYLQ